MSIFSDIAKKYGVGAKAEPAKPAGPVVNVVQAQPKQTISGVVTAQPNAVVRPPSFVGPIQPKTPAASLLPRAPISFNTNSTTPASLLVNKSKQELDAITAPSTSVTKNFVGELPGAVGTTAKEVARALPRAALSVMSSAFNKESAEPIQAETPAQRFFIGEKPVTPIARRVSDLEMKGQEYAKQLEAQGHSDLSALVKKGALPFALAGVIGETTLDLYPGGGGRSKAVKQASAFLGEQLAKNVAKDEALNLMYKQFGAQVGKEVEMKVLPRLLNVAVKEGEQVIASKFPKAVAPLVESTVGIKPKSKEYGFITNVKQSANTAKRQILADRVSGGAPTITNQATLDAAKRLVDTDINEALKVARSTTPSAESSATAMLLVEKYSKEGNFELAIDLVEDAAKKARQGGQANQAFAMWSRLTPEGVLRYAQRQFDQANVVLPKGKKPLKLTGEFAKRLRTQAENLTKLPEGSRTKIVEQAKMLKMIADEIPTNVLKKISLVQTMGQLLNPKTILRNIIGNTGFAIAENIKDVVAAPLDWMTSLVTKQRTKALPSFVAQARGFNKGLKEGFEDAWLGIDTSAAATQFDLPKGQVFKNKIMKGLERVLGVVLKSPDRAAYQAAFENSLSGAMKLAKTAKPTPEMLHQAHLDGLYRTFQDESVPAKVFIKLKNALNNDKDFGVGDAVLKYPKTPGNLLARGIDYSPAGFLKTVVELAKPLFGHTFDQRAFVESTSRALTGSAALVGTGALLHRLGIITGKRNDDADINALERSTGLGQYKLNLSGLMRFVTSGFDADEAKLKEGDKTISYDWFQPAAIGLSIGANIDENKGSVKGSVGTLMASLGEGVDTLGEQPLVQGITRPFRYATSISDAALQTLKGIPASFIPTVLNQIRQTIDPNQRNIEDPDFTKETLKLAQNKIPGLSQMLPKKYGALGEELKNQNSIIETFVSPGYVDTYKYTPEQKMVLDIYKNTGLKTQAPRLVSATQTVNGKSMKLTGEQQSEMQKVIGKLTQERFNGLVKNSKFLRLSDEKKATEMAGIMSDIFTAAKYELLGHRPKRLSDREKKYIKIIRQNK